ncbi:MAG TPA: phosphopeptide-binding protein [Cyanothece sp. UBA12306]|nr:phosphopeptide-binding protein [Cyanothece sp. UBA12306]
MVICPNCAHHNPPGAIQCEACYTSLPQMTHCPYCNSSVETNATFCEQCGGNLKNIASNIPSQSQGEKSHTPPPPFAAMMEKMPPDPWATFSPSSLNADSQETPSNSLVEPSAVSENPPLSSPPQPSISSPNLDPTVLQLQKASLFHVQTETQLELPQGLEIIHLGKPNSKIPPDLDVSGFPHADVVSRIHADIRFEGGDFYIEDMGSSNGTYINHKSLPQGNRHRLRSGDRIGLGKGDLVTLIFQIS